MSNTLNARKDLQDGYHVTLNDAANVLLKITHSKIPFICRSQANQYAALVVAHGVEWKASKVPEFLSGYIPDTVNSSRFHWDAVLRSVKFHR